MAVSPIGPAPAVGPADNPVIAGHFGVAAAVKGARPRLPLWALMFASVWLDVVFVPLLAAGVETSDNAPGTDGGYGELVIHADYTHSLVGALILSGVLGLVAVRPWGRRAGAVLAAVAFSHWVLDLVVHRGDLPILPGNAGDLPLLGLGLWRAPVASAVVELALVAAGAFWYARAVGRLGPTTDTADTTAGTTTAAVRRRVGLGLLVGTAGILTLAADVFLG